MVLCPASKRISVSCDNEYDEKAKKQNATIITLELSAPTANISLHKHLGVRYANAGHLHSFFKLLPISPSDIPLVCSRTRRKITISLTALAYLQARLPVWHNSSLLLFIAYREARVAVKLKATTKWTLSVLNNHHEESKVHCTRHLESRTRKSHQNYSNMAKPSQAKILYQHRS
jgi:hypothetical protein